MVRKVRNNTVRVLPTWLLACGVSGIGWFGGIRIVAGGYTGRTRCGHWEDAWREVEHDVGYELFYALLKTSGWWNESQKMRV